MNMFYWFIAIALSILLGTVTWYFICSGLQVITDWLSNWLNDEKIEEICIDTTQMTLVSKTEYDTPYGKAVREEFRDGKRTIVVTATPPTN